MAAVPTQLPQIRDFADARGSREYRSFPQLTLLRHLLRGVVYKIYSRSKMKKIILTKTDTAEMAVIKLLKCKDDHVILSVPNFSKLAHSQDHFQLIKQEADDAGKRLAIESVDDMVVELARRSEIEAHNPFFTERNKRQEKPLEPDPEATIVDAEPEPIALDDIKDDITSLSHDPGRRWGGTVVALATALAIVIPGFYLANNVLPQAEIMVTMQKQNWDYEANVTVATDAKAVDLANSRIPGQIVIQKKNGQLTYLARGKKKVNRKASGTVTIYNNYSSAPQSLVASTRFETPDGFIFRLTGAVIIPGAIVNDGKVTPSSVTAPVLADKGGEAYNIGPVAKFTIPGFKRSAPAKYDGFYAASSEAMRGGFSGESAYPTDDDIKMAKEKSVDALKDGLALLIKSQLSADLKLVDGLTKYMVISQQIHPDVNEKNEFTISIEAEMSALAFREADIKALVGERMKQELNPDFISKSSTLVYGNPKRDKEKMTLPITYQAQLERKFNADQLKQQLAGKSDFEMKALLLSTPGLASAKISFWPFWVKRVLNNDKLTIKVQ